MPKLDWELTIAQLTRRVSKWKDSTLIQRLEALGYQHYKPKTVAKIRAGRYHIPVKTRARLEAKYRRMAQAYGKQLKKGAPIKAAPIGTGTWYTLEHYLKMWAKKRKEFNYEFSLVKLSNRGFNFVWTRGSRVIFTDKRLSTDPTGPVPNQGYYGIYEVGITIIDRKTYAETFMQASHTVVYGKNPTADNVWKEVKNQIEVFEQRNREVINTFGRKQLAYNWNDEVHEGEITFVGIGVKL